MKKVFLLNQFGSPFDWNTQWVKNVQHLGKYGYDFMIFTPNDLPAYGNVKVIPMDITGFNKLVNKTLGVNPNLFITDKGIPNFHVTEFILALGEIFQDYTKDYEFWGATGFDNVFGRLDHFITDDMLSNCDVFSDDVNALNGNFMLCRNRDQINTLFKRIENWKEIFTQSSCNQCITGEGGHFLYSPEEYIFNRNLDNFKKEGLRFAFPKYHAYHSYDRLILHVPKPQLEIKDDYSLWEKIQDTNAPDWEFFNPMAREIAYFHFSTTKKWPITQK